MYSTVHTTLQYSKYSTVRRTVLLLRLLDIKLYEYNAVPVFRGLYCKFILVCTLMGARTDLQ